ncbi:MULTISPECIES: histidine kinase [Arsenicicoccus]|uniref:Histidine kinase n=1 Tax=Arsenicicoccus bolidensis TaxID=229480 RepID=A0ABS9PZ99_9MICO|nr:MULTISPECIES: histidine kinase [Arsenicicoccus]MCG7320954.1 histidine kinase [Arsenicicoccus bolidensis]
MLEGPARSSVALIAVLAALLVLAAWLALRVVRVRRTFSSPVEEATYDALHTAGLAAPHLKDGLTPEGSAKAARHLRALLGVPALAILDTQALLVWEGTGERHAAGAVDLVEQVLATGDLEVVRGLVCVDEDCPIRSAVAAPIVSDETVIGALVAYAPDVSYGLTRATREVASWVSTNVELAELSRQRTRTMEAELLALRAQISPHFVYNSLAAIASFVRTDPVRARELLLEFADFTRYSFRSGGAFTTLEEELVNIERYLALEQARFGPRLKVDLDIAPEVLGNAVPYLSVQPLVENAVRHGLERKVGDGTIRITARDLGTVTQVSVEDDGAGSDPERVRSVLSGEHDGDNVGLGNVDARLRQVYGDAHGVVVETAPGAGTRVTFTVPKWAPGVHAGQ